MNDSVMSPRTMSAAVELAVRDGRALIADGAGYRPYSESWHTYRDVENVCEVCFAGAVMVKSLNVVRDETLCMRQFMAVNPQWGKVLTALDCVRTGDYIAALMTAWPERDTEECRKALDALEPPASNSFQGWVTYGKFLDDVESRVLPEMRMIGV